MAKDPPSALPTFKLPLRKNYQEHFLRVMEREKFHRREKPGLAPTGEPMWQVYERQKLFFEVNQEREKWFKKPIEMSLIERAERKASGIESKFAWYLAEVVVDFP